VLDRASHNSQLKARSRARQGGYGQQVRSPNRYYVS
jgi:hypothetical protein